MSIKSKPSEIESNFNTKIFSHIINGLVPVPFVYRGPFRQERAPHSPFCVQISLKINPKYEEENNIILTYSQF